MCWVVLTLQQSWRNTLTTHRGVLFSEIDGYFLTPPTTQRGVAKNSSEKLMELRNNCLVEN